MSIILDPPAPLLADPASDDGSNLWELLYTALYPLNDPDPGETLLKYCQALCAPLQPAYDLARERGDDAGWAIVYDADNCPAEVLPYPAQYVGVVLTPEMDEEQQRNEIREPTGWSRGRKASIITTGQRTLTGTKRIIVRPRKPEVGIHYIRTLKAETPSEERTEAVLRAALPAWEVLEYEALDGVSWADVEASWEDWAAVEAAFDSWADLADLLPDELP